jgi:hypothetical protein
MKYSIGILIFLLLGMVLPLGSQEQTGDVEIYQPAERLVSEGDLPLIAFSEIHVASALMGHLFYASGVRAAVIQDERGVTILIEGNSAVYLSGKDLYVIAIEAGEAFLMPEEPQFWIYNQR